MKPSSQDEIQVAAIELGNTFNRNVEFIINVLKAYGGMEVHFEPLTRKIPNVPANDVPAPLPDISALTQPTLSQACTCPPMEAGIIGYRHMASCPQFEG